MYNVSDAYIEQIKNKVQTFRLTGTVNNTAFTHHDILTGSFEITNQCAEQNEVKIGSVYIGELKCTFKPDIIQDWNDAKIIVSEGLKIAETWEDVPLGEFYISSAEDTDYGIDVVAYDAMSKFNKRINLSTTIGTVYDLITLACNDCDVEFGMTRAQTESFANGKDELSLYTENDIETYQDFIFWLAQTTGTFATINRSGKLVLRAYGKAQVDSLTDHDRFNGSKFSRFSTRYSGVSCVNIADQTTSYYGADEDLYLTYNLGSNPFMQYGTDEYKEKLRTAVLDALLQIDYVPFETSVLCGALYDLGDVIRCTDGIASDRTGCIMYYDYIFNGGYKIAGYGADPALASAKSKTDKNLEGLRSNASSNNILFFTYVNATDISIQSDSKNIIDIRFTSGKAMTVLFQAEVLLSSHASTEDTIATITYSLNGVDIEDYMPTEIYRDGRHILSLMYVLKTEENTLNRWVVSLSVAGGKIDILKNNIRATIYGQGLVGTQEWNGYLEIEDKLAASALMSRLIKVDALLAYEEVSVAEPEKNDFSDMLADTILANRSITQQGIVESLSVRWDIKSWTFNTESEATYVTKYVDISGGVYRYRTEYAAVSVNEQIDTGLMNSLSIDIAEFKTVTSIAINNDTDVKYLIYSVGEWYTINNGSLQTISLSGTELSADDFMINGSETPPSSEQLITLGKFTLYKYTAAETINDMLATIDAEPFEQTIQAACDMSDASIHGISRVSAIYAGDVYVKLSYNGGLIFTDEMLLSDALTGALPEVYEHLSSTKILTIAFILKDKDSELTEFKYEYNNEHNNEEGES